MSVTGLVLARVNDEKFGNIVLLASGSFPSMPKFEISDSEAKAMGRILGRVSVLRPLSFSLRR